MRIKDYGQHLIYYKQGDKYNVSFYKHNKFTHSIMILPEDVAILAKAFSRYEVRNGDDTTFTFIDNGTNLFYIDANMNSIGLGTISPSVPLKLK